MRGENAQPRKYYSAATIVDNYGTPKYHVLPSSMVTFGLASMGLLLIIAIILGFLVLRNRSDIDDLRQKIKVEEGQR